MTEKIMFDTETRKHVAREIMSAALSLASLNHALSWPRGNDIEMKKVIGSHLKNVKARIDGLFDMLYNLPEDDEAIAARLAEYTGDVPRLVDALSLEKGG
jgi:hypothetical protein